MNTQVKSASPKNNLQAQALHYVVVLVDRWVESLYVDGRHISRFNPAQEGSDAKEAFDLLCSDTAEMYNTKDQWFFLTEEQSQLIANSRINKSLINWDKTMEICQFQPIMLVEKSEADEVAEDLLEGLSADIWFDAGQLGDKNAEALIKKTQQAMQKAAELIRGLRAREEAIFGVGESYLLPMANGGENQHGYVMEVGRRGDKGLYDELGVIIRNDQGDCVSDVLVGLTPEGEPRVMFTLNGAGDGDHSIDVYPMRDIQEAVLHRLKTNNGNTL